MSNGKPQTRKTPIERQIQNSRDIKKAYGIMRNNVSGVKSINSSSGMSSPPVNNAIGNVSYLKTHGDTMIGPIAFKLYLATISSNTITISKESSSYSSYVQVTGVADTINTIAGAAFGGQLLFLQGTQTITYTLGTTGNIKTIDGTNYSLVDDNVIVLIFDITTNKWQQITRGADSGANQTPWTSNIDAAGYNLTNTGSISTTTLAVSGLAALNGSVSLGNDSTDIIVFGGKLGSDVNLNTYDIYNVNRLKFGQTAGSGNDLLSTDTGIQSIYSGGLPFGMKFQIPSTNSAVYSIYRGTTEMINISVLGTAIYNNIYLGSSSSSIVNINGRVRANNATEIGFFVDNSGSTIGSQGTMGLPYISSADNTPTDATIDGWFGNRNGNIGIQYYSTGGQNRIWIRSNNTWTVAYAT